MKKKERTLYGKKCLTCESDFYAEVIEVGAGKNTKVEIKIYQGDSFICQPNRKITKELRKNSYKLWRLSGISYINPKTMEMIAFKIKAILDDPD